MTGSVRYWAVVPAAGIGSRMHADIPKQYLEIHGTCILEHTVQRFCEHPRIEGIVVAISAADQRWESLDVSRHEKVIRVTGGLERFNSVLNGLLHLEKSGADPLDWVLVHDAVRPCLRKSDIDRLIEAVSNHEVGGLLAFPARDTIKRSNTKREVVETVDREDIWHAQTPQMFRLGMLTSAIDDIVRKNLKVTDEAQAIELAGGQPLLVQGSPENIKITHQIDMQLAGMFISEAGKRQ